ncbi:MULTISPECIES: hypothetical protein [unclassified Wolbachia]|uniref:hypothetical protein n=1 Tax=unclassified Wolbachia TaxID=2640676 RepID=UPI001CF3D16A|nr:MULTISPECIES: hypothetical protein [unclassified Wolbachia]MCA7010865.1 hypothetical protein [Wolbachia endosymbiont of Tribolium confusum]
MSKNANEQSILDTNFKRVQQNLLSHFEDMIPNDITKFPEIEKKVSGFTRGYIAQYRYNNGTVGKFCIKSFYNGDKDYYDNDIAELIREYIAGDVQRLLLYNRSPKISIITQKGKKDRIYLGSKFLLSFLTYETLIDMVEPKDEEELKGELRNVKGYNKILAAGIILRDRDINNTGNIGIMETYEDDSECLALAWGKIDLGKTFARQGLDTNAEVKAELRNLLDLNEYANVDLQELSTELKNMLIILEQNQQKLNSVIENKSSKLNENLNKNTKFYLYTDKNFNPRYNESKKITFIYSNKLKQFVSQDDEKFNLAQYFKEKLYSQMNFAKELVHTLDLIIKIDDSEPIKTIDEYLDSEHEDFLTWSMENTKATNLTELKASEKLTKLKEGPSA